jgi:prepilin-type N-terminal cleavage/methylation domain-containing protein
MRNIRSAFTLIEVLIAVGVAAVAVPQFLQSAESSSQQSLAAKSRTVSSERVTMLKLPDGFRFVRVIAGDRHFARIEAEREVDGVLTRSVLLHLARGGWSEELRIEVPAETNR